MNVTAAAQGLPKTTLLQDVVYRADGSRATGWLVISWPAFVTADGAAVAAGTKSVQLASDGSFSVALAPNAGGRPAGTYYSATLKLDGGGTSKEAWLVPSATPATLASVRASVVPATMATQALTTDWANSNLVSLAGTQAIAGAKSFAVPPSAPDPVNATDLANKEYVDANSAVAQSVPRTNSANTWTQPQTFSSAVMTDAKQYPITAYGAVSGQDATQAMNSVSAMVPANTGGTMFLPAGKWNRTTTFTPPAGFFNLVGPEDGWYQNQATIDCSANTSDCIFDSNKATSHSFHLKGFGIRGDLNGSGDCVHFNGTGNVTAAIDSVTAINCGGAAFHLQNSYTTHLSRLYSQYATYGLFLDGANEIRVKDSQFSEGSICNVGGTGVANDVEADFSILKNGATAAICMNDGSQMNAFRGYAEFSAGANYAEHTLANFTTNTISQDLSHVWVSDTAAQCVDQGYNNTCPKGQGYEGSWHAVSYTNLWPNSSFTSATAAGLNPAQFTFSQDTTSNAALTARGSSGKFRYTGSGNGYIEKLFTVQANHAYVFKGLMWADQPYWRKTSGGPFVEAEIIPDTGVMFPSPVTGFYVDSVPREFCYIGVASANGAANGGTAAIVLTGGVSGTTTLWMTDVVFADVTNIHGSNLCELPYVETFGSTPAQYSSVKNVILPGTVVGTGTTIAEDAPGTVVLGTVASGSTNGTAAIGDAANPVGSIYSNTIAANGVASLKGNSAAVVADFTTANNTQFQTIAGLTLNVPATAYAWKYHCALAYSQAGGNAAVAFGIQAATANPTNVFGIGEEQITTGAPSTSARGVLAGLTTTAPTAIVSGTPGATATNYAVTLDGTFENPAAANSINFVVSTATGADAVTVKRGSECQIW